MNTENEHACDESLFRPVCFQGQNSSDLPAQTPVLPPVPLPANIPSKRIAASNTLDLKRARKDLAAHLPPTFVRKFRSRSLPIIQYSRSASRALPSRPNKQRHQHQHPHPHHHTNPPSVPPINLTLLKEIDLHEILKNPQLRHDILFDPQLQFRPNLDGERGRRKRLAIDKYWAEIERECKSVCMGPSSSSPTLTTSAPMVPPPLVSRLAILFQTVRDILVSLLPAKDRPMVTEIMDIDFLVQQLYRRSFEFVGLAEWLAQVFKSHCAPMRDPWVGEMLGKFADAHRTGQVAPLVQGLRMVFQILEAMKLDVANHQIRILRPVLVETAVDFERDYFHNLLAHRKLDIADSLSWFYKHYTQNLDQQKQLSPLTNLDDANQYSDSRLRPLISQGVVALLLCRHMAAEFPLTLAFDHTRLVLLRADVRQLVCVELCLALYRQLSAKNANSVPVKQVQDEVRAIVTDDNGNIKWTRNIHALALQLAKHAAKGDPAVAEFAHSWLAKHVQPSLQVYGLMEQKVFRDVNRAIEQCDDENTLFVSSSVSSTPASSFNTSTPSVLATATAPAPGSASASALTNPNSISNSSASTSNPPSSMSPFKGVDGGVPPLEIKSVATRIAVLAKFHWSVFGQLYVDFVKSHTKLPTSGFVQHPGLLVVESESEPVHAPQDPQPSRGNSEGGNTKMPVLLQ